MTDHQNTDAFTRNLAIERTDGGSVDYRDGQMQHSNQAPTEHRAPTTSSADQGGRLVNVISRERGRAVPASEAKETDLIEYEGGKYSLRTLINRGAIIREQDGALRFASPSEKAGADKQRAEQQKASEKPAAQAEAVSGDVEAVITEVATSANPSDVIGVINDLSKGSEPTEDKIGRIASQMHVEPEAMAEKVATIRTALEGQALKSVSGYGVDPQDVMDWAYANAPQEMQRAIHRHATQRTTSGYKGIAEQYVQNLDKIDPGAILGAELPSGWTAKQAPNGRVILVSPEGREHTWAALAKGGRISLSKRTASKRR